MRQPVKQIAKYCIHLAKTEFPYRI